MSVVRNLRPREVPPFRTNPDESPKARGVQLQRIPWGKPDPALARVVLRHMQEANPPIVISWNPVTHPRLIAWLRSSGIYH